MRKTLSNPVFLACLMLAIVNQVIEKGFGVFIPVIHSYLDDVLCMPIVLTCGLAFYRLMEPDYKLCIWHMLPVLLVYSIYFEWYLPQVSAKSTADIFDVFMYLVGLTIFHYFINNKKKIDLVSIKAQSK